MLVRASLLLLSLFSLARCDFPQLLVSTSKGVVIGIRFNVSILGIPFYRGVGDSFAGIPFARPPVNELRFKPPMEELPRGQTPLVATKLAPKCPQPASDWLPPPGNMSEDCLYLNVFSPDSTMKGHYPVMFWIHGGGFVIGGTSDYPVPGVITNLVNRGVVVVTTSYRLGLLGFFTTLTCKFPANLGLLDQVQALKWVRREIYNFGGNPNDVTIFGESAGACSVSMHALSPMSRGLFNKVIMQSGSALLPVCLNGLDYDRHPSRNAAMQLCHITQEQWDSQQFDTLDRCLRQMSWQDIGTIHTGFMAAGIEVWPPVVDGPGGFLPDWPQNLQQFRQDLPVMIGATKDEFSVSFLYQIAAGIATLANFTEETYHRLLNQFVVTPMEYGDKTDAIRRLVDLQYRLTAQPPIAPTHHLRWLQLISRLASDKYLFSSSLREARSWVATNHQKHVYFYSFDYASPARPFVHPGGYPFVPHTEDLLYVFDIPVFVPSGVSHADFKVIDTMGQLWTSFAKLGCPILNGDTAPPFTGASEKFVKIDVKSSISTGFQCKADVLWNYYIPTIAHWGRKMKHIGQTYTVD